MTNTIQQIEADAARNGVTMTEACRRAGVNYSTWWRWRHSKHEPRSSKLDRLRETVNATRK
jgi:transposase-like protein